MLHSNPLTLRTDSDLVVLLLQLKKKLLDYIKLELIIDKKDFEILPLCSCIFDHQLVMKVIVPT